MEQDLQRQIRATPHDRQLRLVYSDWLEENGFSDRAAYLRALVELVELLERGAGRDALEERALHLAGVVRELDPSFAEVAALGAERWGGALGFAPVRFEVQAEPPQGTAYWDFAPQLTSTIFVVGDFFARPDPRFVEDRRDLRVSRENFERCLAEAKLRFTIDGVGQIAVTQSSDFDPEGIAVQIAAETSLSGAELERAVSAVFRDPAFLQAERAWRSLRMLLQHAADDIRISFVNVSKDDLVADFEDAPDVGKSGLFKLANSYNHHGMQPYELLVLDHDLDPASARDRTLLAQLGEVGRRSVLPIVAGLGPGACSTTPAPEHPAHTKWRSTPEAFYVSLCTPSFELRRTQHGTLRGSAAFLTTCLAAESSSRLLCAGPLLGSVPVTLAEPIDVELARDRGYLAFAPGQAGASLRVDATCLRGSDAVRRSLSAALLVTRMAHHILNIDLRASTERDVGRLTTRFNRALAARFAAVAGVSVSTTDLEWISERYLGATITVTVPSPVSTNGTSMRVPVLLRMDR